MDFSKNTSLITLAEAIASVQSAADALGCPIFLAGALARDLWLTFGFEIDSGRRTEDVDLAVQCSDWDTCDDLAEALAERGVERVQGTQHKFRHPNGREIDLIPFGGVEKIDRTVAWPPDGNPEMRPHATFAIRKEIDQETCQRLKDRIEQDLAIARLELHDAMLDYLDVEGVLTFAEHLLGNPARLWTEFDLDQKQRFQRALFREGLAFAGANFGTAEINPVFRALRDLEAEDGRLVAHTVPSWNQIGTWLEDIGQLRAELQSCDATVC